MSFRDLPPARRRFTGTALALGLTLVIGTAVVPVLTNSLSVDPTTTADNNDHVFTLDDLRPAACGLAGANIHVTNIVSGGEPAPGTGANDLMLADTTTRTMDGSGGDDCIVATADVTSISGGAGTNDVCIGDVSKMDATCEVPVPL